MRKEEIAEVVRIETAEVLAKRDEIIEDEFDSRCHDVNLLMKNYRKLKTHYTHISPETLEVSSICSVRRKTGLMMSRVDKMLTAYKALCQDSASPDEIRRWNALYLRYIDNKRMSVETIADQLRIDKRTFYRDINKAMEDMALIDCKKKLSDMSITEQL